MASWRLSVTGGSSIDLDETFDLQHHRRQTNFIEQVIDGVDGGNCERQSVSGEIWLAYQLVRNLRTQLKRMAVSPHARHPLYWGLVSVSNQQRGFR